MTISVMSRALLIAICLILSVASQTWYQQCAPGVCIPQSVHLALTGNPSEMNVGWFTLYESQTSTVKFGLSPQSLNSQVEGTQSSYLQSTYDDVTFFQHFATITGLTPSTMYYYQCGDQQGGWSEVYSFTTAPATGTSPSFAFALYADMGIANAQWTISQVIDRAESGEIDFVFHIGDIGYADDYVDGMYEAVWDQWFASVEPITSIIPYMVSPGNHEYSCYDPIGCAYATNFTVYLNRFQMPYKNSGGVNNMWYSYDYANVHFVSISTETDLPDAPEGPTMFGDQLDWLEKDLATAAANPDIDWIIVGGHRPIYSSACPYSNGTSPTGYPAELQAAIEGYFHQYHVDVYVCGHVHSYERDYPTYQNSPVYSNVASAYTDPQATVYLVSGAAGCTEGFETCWGPEQPDWSAVRITEIEGYGVFTVNQNSLVWNFYQSTDNTVLDTFTITKS